LKSPPPQPQRLDELAAKDQAGALTPAERAALDGYLHVGLLDLRSATAHLALRLAAPAANDPSNGRADHAAAGLRPPRAVLAGWAARNHPVPWWSGSAGRARNPEKSWCRLPAILGRRGEGCKGIPHGTPTPTKDPRMTLRSWLRALFTRYYPSPARRPRDAAPDVRRVPAWYAADLADGGRPGTPPDAVTRASRNPSFATIQFPGS
jgi:hypothetical protein